MVDEERETFELSPDATIAQAKDLAVRMLVKGRSQREVVETSQLPGDIVKELAGELSVMRSYVEAKELPKKDGHGDDDDDSSSGDPASSVGVVVGADPMNISALLDNTLGEEMALRGKTIVQKVALNAKILLWYDLAKSYFNWEGDIGDFICDCVEDFFAARGYKIVLAANDQGRERLLPRLSEVKEARGEPR